MLSERVAGARRSYPLPPRPSTQQIHRDREPGRAPAAGEGSAGASRGGLLATLSMRASARGRPSPPGWLGKVPAGAFEGQPDKHGNPTWDVFLAEPELRDGPRRPPASPPGRDSGSGREGGGPSAL